MRADRTLVALLFVASAVGCSDKAPTPSTLPTTITLTTALTPGNEVPPVTNADASASGTVTVTLNVERDSAGSITGGTADFTVNMVGFPAGTVLTGAHIHQAVAGVNSGIMVNTGIASGEIVLATGSGSFTRRAPAITAAQLNSLAGGIAAYFNVHTTINPGGAIRGQLAVQ